MTGWGSCARWSGSLTLSGTKESYQDKLADPATMGAVRRVWLLFQTNFLMSVAGNPHRELLQATAQQMEDLYRFVMGPLVGSSIPPPGPLVMMCAERAMWQELAIAVHNGQKLPEAMQAIKSNSLFWTHWVYRRTRVHETPFTPPGHQVRQSPWNPQSPLYRKGQSIPAQQTWGAWQKSKGKGEHSQSGPYATSGKSSQRRAWVEPAEFDHKFASGEFAKMVSGKPTCTEYQKSQCRPGYGKSCRKSHACPKVLQSGQPCGAPHHRGAHCTSI